MDKLEDKVSFRELMKKDKRQVVREKRFKQRINPESSTSDSQMLKEEKRGKNKQRKLFNSFKNISVYDGIILQIQHAHYVINLMNKKGSPSHIILNCSGNYAGNKNSKISRERKKLVKKKKSETTESGKQKGIRFINSNIRIQTSIEQLSAYIYFRIIRQRDVEFHT